MTKHASKSDHLQLVDLPKTTTVEIPLPLLGAFVNIENSFFALCIDAGQQVLSAMMEQDREELCGPRWKRDPDRSAGRAGTTKSEITLGGRRIPIPQPRVRSRAGKEMELQSFTFASNRDPLDRHALNAVACGISSRKYAVGARIGDRQDATLSCRSTTSFSTPTPSNRSTEKRVVKNEGYVLG